MANCSGFTLWQGLLLGFLLVAVAVLITPVFQKVKDPMPASICASNLMNLTRALRLYGDDNNGFLPDLRLRMVAYAKVSPPAKNAPWSALGQAISFERCIGT